MNSKYVWTPLLVSPGSLSCCWWSCIFFSAMKSHFICEKTKQNGVWTKFDIKVTFSYSRLYCQKYRSKSKGIVCGLPSKLPAFISMKHLHESFLRVATGKTIYTYNSHRKYTSFKYL